MLRTASRRLTQVQDAPGLLFAQSREYLALGSVEFVDDLSTNFRSSKVAPNIMGEWSSTKSSTEHTLRMLETYKQIGDSSVEPYLHFHNPRTFEDMDKAIPNFKKFGLKAGEVPKFFDNVLQKRASEAVELKGVWWNQRKAAAEEAISTAPAATPFAALPLPKWQLGKPVALEDLKKVTDSYFKALEPPRKLRVPSLPAQVSDQLATLDKTLGADGSSLKALLQKAVSERAYVEAGGKPQPGFKYVTAADAERALALRRQKLHARFLGMWARRIMATPEQALVPLRERDHLLASKFEDVSDKYRDLVALVARGTQTYGERLAGCAAVDGLLLCRDRQKIKDMFPPSEQEKEAVVLAGQLEDKKWALEKLLGPALTPEGSATRLKSQEARELAEHHYTSDRYMYAEGMKLAKRYEEEEAALGEQLTKLYGSAEGLLAAQRSPATPLDRVLHHGKEAAARVAYLNSLKEEHQGNPYMDYALTREGEFYADPANIAHEELLLPKVITECFSIEMAELDEAERRLEEAEEEELWLLTLHQQARHMHQHLEFDLPQSAVAHMDPILYKKLDWEVTHGHDLLHHEMFQAADCEQGEYMKDQMGLENLSHHLLPLLRYRRKKFRAQMGCFPPELTHAPKAH